MLEIVMVGFTIAVMVALVVAYIVAEIRAAIWMRTPPSDPWVKHTLR